VEYFCGERPWTGCRSTAFFASNLLFDLNGEASTGALKRGSGESRPGSALTHHPHVHMIVPGGGLARLFRGKMLALLMAAHKANQLTFFNTFAGLADKRTFKRFIAPLQLIKWVVYCKAPFAGPEQVLRYLSRYTHRVAISNRRLVAGRWRPRISRKTGKPLLFSLRLACRGIRAMPKDYIGFQGGNRRRRRIAALYDAWLIRILSGRRDRIDCRDARRNRVARIERQYFATDDGRNERRRGAPFGSDQQDRPSSGR
jgi:hypothetical protein